MNEQLEKIQLLIAEAEKERAQERIKAAMYMRVGKKEQLYTKEQEEKMQRLVKLVLNGQLSDEEFDKYRKEIEGDLHE